MQAGALDGDVIPLLLGIESAPLLLKAQILSGYATTTGGGDVGEREALGTIRESFGPLKKEIKRSIICHGLGHDGSSISFSSPRCLFSSFNGSSRAFDQVVQATTRCCKCFHVPAALHCIRLYKKI